MREPRFLLLLSLFKSAIRPASLCIGLLVLSFTLPFVAAAQVAKVPRVGVLTTLSLDRPHLKGLRDGLEAAGYVNGNDLFLDMTQRKDFTELQSAARGFVKNRFDVLVTTSNRGTDIAHQVTHEIPIVFMPASDPVKAGFVKSYAQPGTNMTGVVYFRDVEYSGKLLELFKELLPQLNSVTVLNEGHDSENNFIDQVASVRKVAAHLDIRFTAKLARNTEEILAVISGLSRGPDQGVLLICSALFSDLKRIAAHAKGIGVPLQGCSASQVVDDGALFSYAPDLYQIGRRAAWYVTRILKGAKPEVMPVETPRSFEFIINLKTANAIGVQIPPEVLQRANRVIE